MRKTTWNSEGADFGPQKRQFKDFNYRKPESKGNGIKDTKNNFNANKNNKNNEKKRPLLGCFTCRGNHYASKCPSKFNTN